MGIEQRIFNNLVNPMNEATQYNDNGQVSADLAKGMENGSFQYGVMIVTPAGIMIPANIIVDINEDDVEAIESDDVTYVYLNVPDLDYALHETGYAGATNLKSVVDSITGFRVNNSKCWRDGDKLYLLKMNRNSGIIGRFDQGTGTFKQQEINYGSSDNDGIARDLLTKEYLQEYLSHELIYLNANMDLMFTNDIDGKRVYEQERRFEVR